MEDQQPHPRDLTAAAEGEESAPDAVADTVADAGTPSGAEITEATTDSTETADDDVDEAAARTGPMKRRLRWRPLTIAASVSAALFVGAAGFAGAALQLYLADRAVVAIKQDIVRTAVNAITTLWNYTPENMDTLPDRAAVYLSGDLEAEYRKFIDAITPANKQAKVTDTTEITGAAVESLDGPEATVILYTNTSATSEATKSIPSLKYLSYRLFMKRDQNRWVITKMPTITSLDLTPRV